MERECCLSLLITLVGGATLLAWGWWPVADVRGGSARSIERVRWRQIWLPVAPALAVAAALCGWALVEPDPVPDKMPTSLILMSLPFALLCARAAVRSAWAVLGDPGEPAMATVGLLRPWIVFSPHLAQKLNEQQIAAALEHERAHARHGDPLRIWLAQLAIDLQWPWPQARERLQRWLLALELARDEEAREAGIEGTDLAEVIVASARFGQTAGRFVRAALISEPAVLKERIERLLDPPPTESQQGRASAWRPLIALMPALVLALALGSIAGERAVRALFWIAA